MKRVVSYETAAKAGLSMSELVSIVEDVKRLKDSPSNWQLSQLHPVVVPTRAATQRGAVRIRRLRLEL